MILLLAMSEASLAHPDLVVHEWGTFTVVADADGQATAWRPLLGPSDLPGFVHTQGSGSDGIRQPLGAGKGRSATVRMETPVVYFYSPEALDVSLSVAFPQGEITEWYPWARTAGGTTLDWGTFRVLDPGTEADLIDDGSPSHYYPARDVAANLVRVCDNVRPAEVERFLFYRGIGDLTLSTGVTLRDDTITLHPEGPVPSAAVVFEASGGRMGFAVVPATGSHPRPVLDDTLPEVLDALTHLLVSEGLYPREARAMVATWQDHWFEDGLRVLWPLVRPETDALLPLTVSPTPTELVRVLVGRVEVIRPEDQARVDDLLASSDPDAVVMDRLTAAHGRFAEALLVRSDDPRATRLLAISAGGVAGEPPIRSALPTNGGIRASRR